MNDPTPRDTESDRDSLIDQVIQSYQSEYQDAWDTWKHIDTKANQTVAANGIILTALFAFVANRLLPGDGFTRCALMIVVIAVVIGAVAAVLAMVVRRVPRAPWGNEVRFEIDSVIDAEDEELSSLMAAFKADLCRYWARTNKDFARSVRWKVRLAFAAQLSTLVAVLGMATISSRTWLLTT